MVENNPSKKAPIKMTCQSENSAPGEANRKDSQIRKHDEGVDLAQFAPFWGVPSKH